MTFPQTHRTLHEERVTMTILVPTMANAVEGGHPTKLTPVHTLLVLEVFIQESQLDLIRLIRPDSGNPCHSVPTRKETWACVSKTWIV